MWAKQSVKRSLALIFILSIGAFLAYGVWPYRSAFFGAFILYFLFRPTYKWLHFKLRLKSGFSAGLVIALAIIIVLLPVSLLASLLVGQAGDVLAYAKANVGSWTNLGSGLPAPWRDQFTQELSSLVSGLGGFFVVTIKAVGNEIVNYTIMFFLLFYLLVTDEQTLKRLVFGAMPFNKSNTAKLEQEFRNITHSTIVATGLIAVGQAVLLTIGLYLCGVPGALVLGFIGLILAFLPVIGVPVIWLPAAIWLLCVNQVLAGILLLIWGLIISTVDNLIRPMLQRKIGQIHPVVSILGVFVGLSFFGLLGVVIGPLLLSYFLLTIKMFGQEYIEIKG